VSRYILHLITSYVSNLYMYNQIVGVRGYKPVVYGDTVLENLPFEHFVQRSGRNDYVNIARKYPIELVHAHFGSLGAKVSRLAKKNNLPLVTHFRGGDGSNDPKVKDQLKRKYENLMNEGTLFVPVCKALVPMLKDLGFPEEKIQVLYGGIDLKDFPYQTRNFETTEKFRICFVGKTSPKKGIPTLIKAFAYLLKHFQHLELRIISSTPKSQVDLKEFQTILWMIDRLKIQDKVTFLFNVQNKHLHKELHQAHLFCHPSETSNGNIEGIPNALKEAMATGLPSISTYHAGIPELIKNQLNGWLVPESDPAALAYAMGQCITNPALCQRFAEQGHKTIEEKFDLKKQLLVQKQMYDSLVERRIRVG